MAKYREKHTPAAWTKVDNPGKMDKPEINTLIEWMESMVEWGKNIRDDIIRLEGALGVSAGDPGDPPPSPWKKT